MPPTSTAEAPSNTAQRSLKDELASLRIERGSPAPVAKARKPRRRFGLKLVSLSLWLIPIAIFGGAGYYAYDQYTKFRPKIEVTTTVVQSMTSGEAEKLLSAKGYLESRYQAMIGAKAPGRVEQMLVEEGSIVTKGQLLAVLEHRDMLEMLHMREATLKQNEASLLELEAEIEDLERKYQRQTRLLARDSAAAQEAENAYYALRRAKARREQTNAAIEVQRSLIAEMGQNIENMKVYAPFDGTVVEKAAEVGETITPGGMGAASGRGSVVTLANLSRLEVDTDVAEGLLSKLAVGQPAEVSVSAVPGKRYRGRLRAIIPMGDRAKGQVKVKVEILDPDARLFPELAATVHFLPDKALQSPESNAPSLYVSKAAIVESNGRFTTWVIERKGDRSSVKKCEVEVMITNDDLARVEKGLVAGQQVVLNPPPSLKEGEAVKVAE
jgi:RND family efflux transporter MFP subunit